jgi:hypothetical protein
MLRERPVSKQNVSLARGAGTNRQKRAQKKTKAGALRTPALQRRQKRQYCVFLTALLQTYSEAPEAASALAAFFAFLAWCFLAAFLAGAEAAAGAEASGAEACAKAAVANRPATRAAISLFMF